jgi:hypothetical protein
MLNGQSPLVFRNYYSIFTSCVICNKSFNKSRANKVKEDLSKDNNIVHTLITVHVAEDAIRFNNIGSTYKEIKAELHEISEKLDTKT